MRGLIGGRSDGTAAELPGDEESVRREGVYHALEGEFAFAITDVRLRAPLAGRRDDLVAWLGALIPYEDWEAIVPVATSSDPSNPNPSTSTPTAVDAHARALAAQYRAKFPAAPAPEPAPAPTA